VEKDMTDLLDMFDEGGLHENAIEEADKYFDERRPSDYTAKVLEYAIKTVDNDNSALHGESIFTATLEILEGTAPLSRKSGGKYEEVDGRPGDKVKIFASMAKDTKTKMKIAFEKMQKFTACINGMSPDDYVKGNTPGPQGLRAAINAQDKVGSVVRIHCTSANKNNFYNVRYELVPSDEAEATTPAKGKAKAKAA
jgi:hypothetical protein